MRSGADSDNAEGEWAEQNGKSHLNEAMNRVSENETETRGRMRAELKNTIKNH